MHLCEWVLLAWTRGVQVFQGAAVEHGFLGREGGAQQGARQGGARQADVDGVALHHHMGVPVEAAQQAEDAGVAGIYLVPDISDEPKIMKTINVVAAIIHRGEEILSTQRGYGEYEGWWEFPGGKIEPGEGPEVALLKRLLKN